MSAAIRVEAKRHEGVKLHLNKVFRLVERVNDQQLKNSIKASLSIVRAQKASRECPRASAGGIITALPMATDFEVTDGII
ncbi:hypothetical protein KIL84_020732 [Mauremys mutica]|uniref:Uncharacterized protein n=1 Tax=Mauremys mutica TaxID=74926 RepID=A0A9D3XAF4_9SAUR|nr:hypothetical protein KIL84_020732 [Mauremys mutica]